MKGWKTWASAAMVAALGIVHGLEKGGVIPPGSGEMANVVLATLAGIFGLTGLGHKLDKIKKD